MRVTLISSPRMFNPSRRCTLFALVFVSVTFLGHGALFAQADPEPLYYIYHGQPKALTLDTGRIAVRVTSSPSVPRSSAALPGSLATRGFNESDVVATPVAGWMILDARSVLPTRRAASSTTAAGPSQTAASSVHNLLTSLLNNGDPSIEFVSPVFRDGLGDPVIITPTILIGFEQNVAAQQRASLRASVPEGAQALKIQFPQPNDERWQIQSQDGFAVLSRANALATAAGVAYAEPDMIVTGHGSLIPNDPSFGDSWGLQNTGQSGGQVGFDLAATSAWDITLGSSSVTVLILDVGVQQDHPDINQITGMDFTTDAASNPDGGPFGQYDNHGTWVAGCISGLINNGLGTTGIAPGVKVASARCYTDTQADGSFTFEFSWVVDALNWGQQTIGARVSNNSNTYDTTSSALESAYTSTRANGMVHFAAAGNNAASSSISYPASIPAVNAVTAANRFGQRSTFSDYGTGLKFIAPGEEILTTDRTGTAGGASGDYAFVSGTSFASAYAAGIAALFVSQSPSFTAADVENQMQRTSRDLGPAGYDTDYGYGMPNASRAVKRSQPTNVSTRLRTETGDNIGIGGFIITGSQSKQVLIRGIGPSLSQHGVANALADPIIELHDSTRAVIATNDNWQDTQASAIQATGLAPSDPRESAILMTLSPGSYTVFIQGTNQTSGVALVEVYDLTPSDGSKLTNISTRGLVQLGDNVMIGGFILAGDGGGSLTVLVRAIGPSLTQHGVSGALQDPVLELHNGSGALIYQNDNWQDTQASAIQATGLAPSDPRESAILQTLAPGNYTAIVRGTNSTIGVALVEVYNLQTN
jgi:subtilisin family serine protease